MRRCFRYLKITDSFFISIKSWFFMFDFLKNFWAIQNLSFLSMAHEFPKLFGVKKEHNIWCFKKARTSADSESPLFPIFLRFLYPRNKREHSLKEI